MIKNAVACWEYIFLALGGASRFSFEIEALHLEAAL